MKLKNKGIYIVIVLSAVVVCAACLIIVYANKPVFRYLAPGSGQSQLVDNTNRPQELPDILVGAELWYEEYPLKADHKFYVKTSSEAPIEGKLYDLEVSTGKVKQILSEDDLLQITGLVDTAQKAVAVTEFFSSTYSRYFAHPSPERGLESKYLPVGIPASVSKLLTVLETEKTLNGWVVKRDLFLYPYWDKSNYNYIRPASLVRTKEFVTNQGAYTLVVDKILKQGDEIDNLLPYYE